MSDTAPRSTRDLLAPAVADSLRALEVADTDQAMARLAERYAAVIDRSSFAAKAAERLLREALNAEDEDLIEQVRALRKLLAEQVALDRLGARLEAVLAGLHGTPAARAKAGKTPPPSGRSKLEQFRSERAS